MYKDIDGYISEVQKHIRWKRAKEISTKELEYHIQDLCSKYCKEGFPYEQALEKAIGEMGKPEKIGNELNAVHRPKKNIALMEITGSFLILGYIINYLIGNPISITTTVAVILGVVIALALYMWDYTIILRHPFVIYTSLMSIAVICIAFEARNGFKLIGYSYSQYLLLLSPIPMAGIMLYIKSKNLHLGLLVFCVFANIPIICAALISSFPTIVILVVTNIIMMIYAVKNCWLKMNRLSILASVCLLIISIFILIFVYMMSGMSSFLPNDSDRYIYESIQTILKNCTFFEGCQELDIIKENSLLISEYPLIAISAKYGFGLSFLLILCFLFLLFAVYKISKRQNTSIGYIMTIVILCILSIQLFSTILNNYGILMRYEMCLPFIVSGGLYTTYNLILIGVLLSISRNEDIVKDWIKYKERNS